LIEISKLMEAFLIILTFFILHWYLSLFTQSFFLHRYCAHGMFKMKSVWQHFFHWLTFFAQGSSYLNPRAYAILHRLHHAHSDTELDPHSPHFYVTPFQMSVATAKKYIQLIQTSDHPLEVTSDIKESFIDRYLSGWPTRLIFVVAYSLFYFKFADHWGYFFLLPIHFLMGPIHGAIVNWWGHKYGYRNYYQPDQSRNGLKWDFLMFGELFQNNHHFDPQSVNFAKKTDEIDPTYPIILLLKSLKIIY